MGGKKKKCFVIMPISDTDGYDNGHFTTVYNHLIKPAVMDAGFESIRADDTLKTNIIINSIIQSILDSDIIVCDLSSKNANVFYELGLSHAFNKKVVLIKDNATNIPFDISGIRVLSYNRSLRIDEVNKSIPEISKCIADTYEDYDDAIFPKMDSITLPSGEIAHIGDFLYDKIDHVFAREIIRIEESRIYIVDNKNVRILYLNSDYAKNYTIKDPLLE